MRLESIQSELQRAGLDGWLFFDHHHRDPLTDGPLAEGDLTTVAFTRAELKQHDLESFGLLATLWNVRPEDRDAAK